MRILLSGDFAPYRLADSYRRAFERLGHEVVPLDTRERRDHLSLWLRSRLGHRLTIGSLGLRRAGSRRWNERLLGRARREGADLALLLNGDLVMPETVAALREEGAVPCILFADDPLRPGPNRRPEHLPAAREAARVFIFSRRLRERLREEGVEGARYLPFAWDPAVFPPQDPPARPEHDVVFIGGWDREREAQLEAVAERHSLRIWGPGYWGSRTRRRGPLRECWRGRALRGPEAAEVAARSRVVLNLLRSQNLPDGTNMRTFEVPGAGGFLLATRTAGAEEIFPDGEAGSYFGSREEMLSRIERHLAREEERRAIARRAHEIVRSGHRYVDRARTILEDAAGGDGETTGRDEHPPAGSAGSVGRG